ncbi:MAG: CotH kinase family protein [Bacteroidales bacterium]|nr:CotH kinase family protein [Bacteroidales bacterium]
MKKIYTLVFVVFTFLLNTQNALSQAVVTLTNSNLPIIVINTLNNAIIVDDPKVDAHMGIINNVSGINKITDAYNDFNGSIGIEFRGNSTQNYPKKPYILETRDASGNNLDVSLLGMPADNDWILLASYLDRTLIRDALAHYISESTGEWSSHSRYCELLVNGNYMGVYLLIEKIKRTKNRLNISKLTIQDNSGEELTGGYIYEVTGFSSGPGDFDLHRVIHYPKEDEVTSEQLNFIKNYDNDFRNVMASATFNDGVNGYEKYINVNSFVDELITQEAMRNSDAYGWSAYFHKDRSNKLEAGPVWDFDQSSGNSTYKDGASTSGWIFVQDDGYIPTFWAKLWSDPRFKYRVKLMWQELRTSKLSTSNINRYIDSCAVLLNQAQERNFSQWPILGVFLWRETIGYQNRNTYEKEVSYLKTYMTNRMAWMDTELNKVAVVPLSTDDEFAGNSLVKLYPNPATDYLVIDTGDENIVIEKIQIYSNTGLLVQKAGFTADGSGLVKINLNSGLGNGLYHLKLVTNANKWYNGNFVIVK